MDDQTGLLTQLANLHAQGLLTDAEFEAKKAALTGKSDAPAPAVAGAFTHSYSDMAEKGYRRSTRIWLSALALVILVSALYFLARAADSATASSANSSQNVSDDHATVVERKATEPVPESKPTVAPETKAEAAEVEEGRCYMGECTYSQKLNQQVIGAGINGKLIKLKLRGGTSSSSGSAISWEKNFHVVYVYCSISLPSVITKFEGNWQVDVLDFIGGVPGILESSERLYGSTCHKNDEKYPNDAAALGYLPIPDDKQNVTINKLEDIFLVSDQ